MVNPKLKEYIDKAKSAGLSDTKIRESLLGAGWPDEEISSAFSKELKAPEPDLDSSKPEKEVKEDSAAAESPRTNKLAIVALIFAFLFAPIGLLLAIISLVKISKSGDKGKGVAIAALIIGAFGMVFTVIFLMGIIAYFGILDPSRLLPEKCEFPAGINCIDKPNVSPQTIELALKNNIGFPIQVTNIISSAACNSAQIAVGEDSFLDLAENEVRNNQVFRIKLTGCNNGNQGAKLTTVVTIDYINTETSLEHKAVGDIRGIVN
ncbi:DUF4190 domain-containing protein [Candidatus Woesearchaeota archaeon]|nr:DUF4190 domain-containing protein [Candidatus Woesearchaeota archaeon]